MIYDGHAYCFPDLTKDAGFADPQQFKQQLQHSMARHFQPVWRKRDRATADSSGLLDPNNQLSFDGLREAQFRAAGYGRMEWTAGGEEYVKQYFPPSVVDMSYPASNLVAEMDHVGVDMALLHRTPYLGIGNDFIADCVRLFPDRLQGLAHVEEWLVQSEPDASIKKLERAIVQQGLSGLQFLPDFMELYGQADDWDGPGSNPFWDAFASLNTPLFITPSYSSLAVVGGGAAASVVGQLQRIRGWMERYPDNKVVLTHGLSWRTFVGENSLVIPDEVLDALPADNPNFHLQLLFPIFLGGIWEYPILQVRPTMEKLVERLGVDRLLWGTDMPIVMRFWTYGQCLQQMRVCCDFLDSKQVDQIVGGNMARLMGLSDPK